MPKQEHPVVHTRYRNFALAADLFALVAFMAVNTMGSSASSFPAVLGLLFAGIAAWVVVGAATGLYGTSHRKTPATACAAAIATSWASAYALSITAHLLDQPLPWGSDPLLLLGLLSTVAIANQYFLVLPQASCFDSTKQLFIAGCNPRGFRLWKNIIDACGDASVVKGFLRFPSEPETLPSSISCSIVGDTEDVHSLLNGTAIDELYICGPNTASDAEITNLLCRCDEAGIPFALPRDTPSFEHAAPVERVVDAQGLAFTHFTTTSRSDSYFELKRLLDVIGAATALLVSLPLMTLVAALIRLDSDGPVFFAQARVGQHGRLFRLLKFRSMHMNAEQRLHGLLQQNEMDGPVFKIRNDPRITRVGRWIRRLSIDELPQFFNVLRGEMSLVGPRPPLPTEVLQYEPWQRRRLSVKPGITCYWQVAGRNNISFREWMTLDLQYIDRASLWLDIELLLKTFPAVLSGRGAS